MAPNNRADIVAALARARNVYANRVEDLVELHGYREEDVNADLRLLDEAMRIVKRGEDHGQG